MTDLTNLDFAVLSLDSYNRGYGPFIQISGSTIGGLTIVRDSVTLNVDPNDPNRVDQAANFYAAAYQDSSGNIVISYRGTDNPGGDIPGWTGGAGFQTRQAELAAEFYYQVKDAYPGATITLTGHSLGGGLAGLMAKLTGSVAYENRPFIDQGSLA
jgi:serralysin